MDSTHTKKVECQNYLIKDPCKAIKCSPKKMDTNELRLVDIWSVCKLFNTSDVHSGDEPEIRTCPVARILLARVKVVTIIPW